MHRSASTLFPQARMCVWVCMERCRAIKLSVLIFQRAVLSSHYKDKLNDPSASFSFSAAAERLFFTGLC